MAKKLMETKAYQRRQAATQRKKAKNEAVKKRRAAAQLVAKRAVETLAEESFGEGGLTPARQEALSSVLLGPDGGKLMINSPNQLRMIINRAKKKFTEHAEQYVDAHLQAVNGALSEGEFDVAARHAEWAMEAFGTEEEGRVAEPAKKVVASAPAQAPIMVGVQLGGVPQSDKT